MFLYLIHKLNHGLFKSDNKSDGAINVRTIIFGGIAYILFHAWINSEQMKDYFVKDYFLWILLIDIFAMATTYKLYYNRSILNELKNYDNDIYVEKEHKYIKPNNDNTINLINSEQEFNQTNEIIHEYNLEHK